MTSAITFILAVLLFVILEIIDHIRRKEKNKPENPEIIIQSDKPLQLKVELKGDVDVEIKPWLNHTSKAGCESQNIH